MKYLLAIIIALPAFADFNRTSGLIDIPSASVLPHLGYRIGFDGSVGLGGEDGNKIDKNIHTALGIANWLELYLDFYTFSGSPTIGFGICHNFYERGNLAVSWGVHDVSYAKHISEVGQGDSIGWFDDLGYTYSDYAKPFELGSAFVISTYSLSRLIDLTIGIGRGKFVGYGTHSKLLNSNVHRSTGGDWAIGLFGGVDIKAFNNFSFMIDIDGRDLNAGFTYRYKPIKLGLALTKIEHIIWGSEVYYPRASFALSYIKDRKAPRFGKITGTVFDGNGYPIVAEVGIFDEDILPVMTKKELGTFLFSDISSGTYEIYAAANGFKAVSVKIDVSSGETAYYDFVLDKIESKEGDIVGKVIDIKTNEPMKARIFIDAISRAVESDPNGRFEFKGLLPDIYTVKVESKGYETGFYQALVNPADKTNLEIKMVKQGMSLILRGITFDYNKARIRPESDASLNEVATILKNNPDIKLEIQGHTDSIGGPAYNLHLSQARADVVREYLVKHRDIDPSRLIARGYGEVKPIASNMTENGRNQNRRVEFLILGK